MEALDAEGREVGMSTVDHLRMEGREEGRIEDKAKGIQKAAQDTARRMLDLGMEIENIALATALPKEEVERIANETKYSLSSDSKSQDSFL